MKDTWRTHEGCMKDAWRTHERCMKDAWRMHAGCMKDARRVSRSVDSSIEDGVSCWQICARCVDWKSWLGLCVLDANNKNRWLYDSCVTISRESRNSGCLASAKFRFECETWVSEMSHWCLSMTEHRMGVATIYLCVQGEIDNCMRARVAIGIKWRDL